MLFSQFALSAALLAVLPFASAQSNTNPDFRGTGQIWVIRGSDITRDTAAGRIGCLAANGHFVTSTSACGTFTYDGKLGPLSSTAGKCSFFDPTAEQGRPMSPRYSAFKCSNEPKTTPTEYFYAFYNGQPFIWYNNLNVYYSVLKVPSGGEEVPLWVFDTEPQGGSATKTELYWNRLSG